MLFSFSLSLKITKLRRGVQYRPRSTPLSPRAAHRAPRTAISIAIATIDDDHAAETQEVEDNERKKKR